MMMKRKMQASLLMIILAMAPVAYSSSSLRAKLPPDNGFKKPDLTAYDNFIASPTNSPPATGSSSVAKSDTSMKPPVETPSSPTSSMASTPTVGVSTDAEIDPTIEATSTEEEGAPLPTPSPVVPITPCSLTSSIECMVNDGTKCSNLSPVSSENVACSGRPSELTWLYRAGSCDSSRANQDFSCKDLNGGPSSAFEVYITVFGMTSGDKYYEGKVFWQESKTFPIQTIAVHAGDSTAALDSTIVVTIRRDEDMGELLQLMKFSIVCDAENELLLGDTFGSLQLESYRNDEQGYVKGVERVSWKYTLQNEGDDELTISNFVADTNGHSDAITSQITLFPEEEFSFFVHDTISLVEFKSKNYGGLTVVGEDAATDSECTTTDDYSFQIFSAS